MTHRDDPAARLPAPRRALTEAERAALIPADWSDSGQVHTLNRKVRGRLLDEGWIAPVPGGKPWQFYITDAGRRAVRESGSSGGRA